MQKKNAARITEIIETKYVRGRLHDFYNKQLQFGLLRSSPYSALSDSETGGQTDEIGYLRIHSFSAYSNDRESVKQLDALETALDDVFKDSTKLTGLVIDVRINGGGSDVFGISIASRLATQEYLAYAKVVRNAHGSTNRKPAREERTPPDGRSNPTVTRHQTTNGGMFFAKSAPDLMQGLPCFQRRHKSSFCSAENPNRLPCFINTTFENSYIPDGVASTV